MALVVAQYADRGKPQDLRQVYSEHAIAVHTTTANTVHRLLRTRLKPRATAAYPET